MDELPGGRRRRLRPRARRGRRHRRRPPAGAGRARLPPLPARPGRLQGRPRGRGRRPLDATRPPAAPGRSTSPVRSRRWSRRSARSTAGGCPSARSSSSPSSTSPTPRARPATSIPVWAYAHVPSGYDGDATEALIDQIERFAPGPARADRRPVRPHPGARSTAYNANYVGGDIITGANTPWQTTDPPAPRARSLRHRHPGRLHLLGRHPARRRRARHERRQRGALGAPPPRPRVAMARAAPQPGHPTGELIAIAARGA